MCLKKRGKEGRRIESNVSNSGKREEEFLVSQGKK